MKRYYKASNKGALTVLIGILSTSIATRAKADDVPAGSDMFITPDNFSTFVDLGDPDATPIPAGFFGPGSDPFTGIITLKGVPLVCTVPCAGADTIVERLSDAVFQHGSSTVDIQIRALHFKSTAPITVTFSGGGASTYDVEVFLSEVCPQGIGSMTINHEFPDGGTFTSQLPVTAKLVFTKVGGIQGLSTATLDPPNCSRTDVFSVTPASPGNWSHVVPPGMTINSVPAGDADHDGDGFIVEPGGSNFPATTNNFHVGICPTGGECIPNEKLTPEEAQWAAHGIEPLNDPPPPPNFGACCDHAAPGGVCVSDTAPQDCVGGQKQFFKDETCANIEAAGLCEMSAAPPQFFFDALPDLPGGASQLHDFSIPDTTPYEIFGTLFSCGQSLDGDGINKAVVWTKPHGQPWQIEVLPNPFGNTESSCLTITYETDRPPTFAGLTNDILGNPQPVVWTCQEHPDACVWSAEILPLPPGYDSGALLTFGAGGANLVPVAGDWSGWVDQSEGPEPHHAALWKKDPDSGLWSVQLLPDYGPGFSSEATSAAIDPVDPLNPNDDLLILGGSVQTESSPQAPCVWQEIADGFEIIELPMSPGAYLGAVTACCDVREDCTWSLGGGSCVGYNARIAGLADLYRGVLYQRVNGVWGAPLELPPLPGMRDSRATGVAVGTSNSPDGLTVVGHSYMELSPDSERATLWEVAPDNTITTYDLNAQTVNLPPDVMLAEAATSDKFAQVRGFTIAGTYSHLDSPSISHGNILILLSGTDCNKNGMDDTIDLYSGTSTDSNGNAILDECEPPGDIVWNPTKSCKSGVNANKPCATDADCPQPVPPVPAPICDEWPNDNTEAAPRALSFRVDAPVTAAGTPELSAIKVTMIDLQNPQPPNIPANPPPVFGPYEVGTCTAVGESVPPNATSQGGCARWVGRPGTFLEDVDLPGGANFRAARLQCTPVYLDWVAETHPVSGPRLIHVVGPEVVPSSEYSVQTYGASCKGAEDGCANVSTAVTMYTRRYGDIEAPFVPGGAASGEPTAIDIGQVVNHLKSVSGAPVNVRVRAQPNVPNLFAEANALDLSDVVDAVKLKAYQFSGPCACPPVGSNGVAVPCGISCTSAASCVAAYGAGATCSKTCNGGDSHSDPCTGDSQCPGGGTCGTLLCRDRCGRCAP